MEDILDIYKRPRDPKRPVVCLDEVPKQLISEIKIPLPMLPGKETRYDYEYKRNGVAHIFMMFEPLANKRHLKVKEHRTKKVCAGIMKYLVADLYPDVEQIILVMDNLNTHNKSSLYEAFEPAEAKRIADKIEIHYTPKHGSWLNMAEIEISILSRPCLGNRVGDLQRLEDITKPWEEKRNRLDGKVNWQFRTEDARIKLKKLYPSIEV